MQQKNTKNTEKYLNLEALSNLTNKEKTELHEEFLNFLQEKKFLLPIKEKGIPISIFNKKLSALESIVKYLREESEMSYKEISNILKRNPGPIGVTYRNAKKKFPSKLDISSHQLIPFSAFKQKLTIFESLVLYLKENNFSFKRIASLLSRNYRTIWTVYNRAKTKSIKKRGRNE